MVTTETLQVILNVKDQLSNKIREVNNALKQTGTAATTAGNTATNATNQISSAYQQLQSKVKNVFNNIRNTIKNSTAEQLINGSGLAQPFLNTAEKVKQKWSSMVETIKSKLKGIQGGNAKVNVDTSTINNAETKFARLKQQIQQINSMRASPRFDVTQMKSSDGQIKLIIKDLDNLQHRSIVNFKINGSGQNLNPIISQMDKIIQRSNKVNSTTISPKISAAGLATLNGQMTTTTGEVTRVSQAINKVGSVSGTLGMKLSTAFVSASSKIDSFKTKLSSVGSKMTSIVSGLSGVQTAIMGAFGAVGITSITQFTVGAAIARQKLNAVTTSITGSEAATKSLNSAISKATSGGIIGFTKVAQAVQQIGIKYGLSNKQLEATAPVLNKIGTLARAMGKDSETAATMMNKAYDGLNGNFLLLKRNLGITKEQLIDAGWSGAANDVDGYTLALNKVLDTKPEMQEYLNSFEGQQERLQLAIQGVGRSIGEIVLPVLNTILSFFLEMHQQAPWLTTALVGIGIALLGVISVLSALAPILFLIEEEIIAIELSTMWPLLVVAAIIAVIAVLKHLYDTNEKVGQTIDHIGQVVQNTFTKAWEKLQKVIEPLQRTFAHLMQVLGRLGSDLLGLFGITGDAADNFDWLGATIEAVGWYIEQQINLFVLLVEVLASVLIPVISFVINLIANLINFFITLGEAITLLMQGDITGFLTTLGEALQTLVINTVENFGQMFLEILNNLNVIFGGVLTSVWSWLVQLITTMAWGGWQMVTGFLSWIMSLPGQFWNYLVQCWNNLVAWASNIVSQAIQAGSNMVNGFISWIQTLPGRFWTWLMSTIDKIKSFASQGVQKMKDTAKQMLDGFVSYIKNLPSKMGEYLDGIKQQIWNKAGGLVSAIMNLGWNMLNSFKDSLLSSIGWNSADVRTAESQLATNFASMSNQVTSAGSQLGRQFSDSLMTGINAGSIDNIGISSNNALLTHVEHEIKDKQADKQTGLLEEILSALGNLRVQHTGSIDFNQNVDVTGETNLSDEELREAVMTALKDKNILKQIVNSRDFQTMDQKMKNRMIKEIGRHI